MGQREAFRNWPGCPTTRLKTNPCYRATLEGWKASCSYPVYVSPRKAFWILVEMCLISRNRWMTVIESSIFMRTNWMPEIGHLPKTGTTVLQSAWQCLNDGNKIRRAICGGDAICESTCHMGWERSQHFRFLKSTGQNSWNTREMHFTIYSQKPLPSQEDWLIKKMQPDFPVAGKKYWNIHVSETRIEKKRF